MVAARRSRHRCLRHRGQDLGQVHGPGPGLQPGQAAADMHQAGAVPRRAHLGPGVQHAAHLVGQHGGGGVRVLDRERAAEAATGVGVRQLDQVDPGHVAQQPERPVSDPQQAQRMAGRMVGDPVRVVRADVLHPEHVHQQLGEFVGAGGHRFGAAGQRLVPVPPGHHGVLVPDRPGARAGRDHDRLAALEDLDVVADQGQRVPEVASVHVHLAAAGLRGRELDLMAKPFQQPDGGPARVGEQGVGQAGHEQRDTHGVSLPPRWLPPAQRPHPGPGPGSTRGPPGPARRRPDGAGACRHRGPLR